MVEEALGEIGSSDGTDRRPPGALGVVTWLSDTLAGFIVLALVTGVTVGVIARAAGVGILGVIELGGLSLVFMTLLAAPGLASRDGHVKIEVIDMVIGPRGSRALDIFSVVVQIAVTAVLLYASATLTGNDFVRGTTSGGELRLPRAWVGLVVPVGAALLLGVLVLRLVGTLRKRSTGSED